MFHFKLQSCVHNFMPSSQAFSCIPAMPLVACIFLLPLNDARCIGNCMFCSFFPPVQIIQNSDAVCAAGSQLALCGLHSGTAFHAFLCVNANKALRLLALQGADEAELVVSMPGHFAGQHGQHHPCKQLVSTVLFTFSLSLIPNWESQFGTGN